MPLRNTTCAENCRRCEETEGVAARQMLGRARKLEAAILGLRIARPSRRGACLEMLDDAILVVGGVRERKVVIVEVSDAHSEFEKLQWVVGCKICFSWSIAS